MAALALPKYFDFTKFIQLGWTTLKNNLTFFFQVFIVYLIATMVPEVLIDNMKDQPLLGLLNWFWQMYVSLGLMRVTLSVIKGKQGGIAEMFMFDDRYVPFLIGNILVFLRVVLGFLLLIVPGVIWSIRFQFVPLLILDKKMSATEAFEYSHKLTDGNMWNLFIFGLVLIAFNILGLIALIVGVFVTGAISYLTYFHVYRYLDAKVSPVKKTVKKVAKKSGKK